MVDKNQQVLRPFISSNSRAAVYGNKAFAELGEKECLANFIDSSLFTASKLKWVKKNQT